MKRMVRILRSTVMVRVGGGWEALDEFLVKHDPCRAKVLPYRIAQCTTGTCRGASTSACSMMTFVRPVPTTTWRHLSVDDARPPIATNQRIRFWASARDSLAR